MSDEDEKLVALNAQMRALSLGESIEVNVEDLPLQILENIRESWEHSRGFPFSASTVKVAYEIALKNLEDSEYHDLDIVDFDDSASHSHMWESVHSRHGTSYFHTHSQHLGSRGSHAIGSSDGSVSPACLPYSYPRKSETVEEGIYIVWDQLYYYTREYGVAWYKCKGHGFQDLYGEPCSREQKYEYILDKPIVWIGGA